MSKSLKVLQHENDDALLQFWTAVELVRRCENELSRTPQWMALQEARYHRDQICEPKMSAARIAYLKARRTL